MKIRPFVWATSLLVLTGALCITRVNGTSAQPQTAILTRERPKGEDDGMTPQQRADLEKYAKAWLYERDHNYKAKLNNGSRRGGMTLAEVPENLRAEVDGFAKQYKNEIYPLLKKHVADNGGLLPEMPGEMPEFLKFMEDKEYKGTGDRILARGSWYIGHWLRLDGTSISRDVYSAEPFSAPHDTWCWVVKFMDYPKLGKGFIISGWDDGHVTFDRTDQLYFGGRKASTGRSAAYAVPGQAGIPPTGTRTLKDVLPATEVPKPAASGETAGAPR